MSGSVTRYHPFDCIIQGKLYLGNRHAAASLSLLRNLGVTHVVNAADEQPNFHPEDLVYYNCYLKDNLTERVDFEGPLRFIQSALDQGGVVFVHCAAGVSRSATIVLAYLMRAHGMSLNQAMQLVVARRPVIDPNPNYVQQLQEFESRMARPYAMRVHLRFAFVCDFVCALQGS